MGDADGQLRPCALPGSPLRRRALPSSPRLQAGPQEKWMMWTSTASRTIFFGECLYLMYEECLFQMMVEMLPDYQY
jgi:hypothetical protein